MAFQPLALLAVAPVLARFAWRALRSAAWRLALPSAAVLLPTLVAAPGRALHAVGDQPYNPAGESSTPLAPFARALGHHMYSGGSLRLVATAAAIVIGYVVCRRRYDLPTVLFVMALCFTLRVVLETELLGFYFFPVVALALVLTLRRSWALFWPCAAASVLCLALGNQKVHHITFWWPAIMVSTAAMVALAALAWWREDAASVPGAATKRSEQPLVAQSHVRLLATGVPSPTDPTDPAPHDRSAGATVG